jgi:NAD(P) transhydrogenase
MFSMAGVRVTLVDKRNEMLASVDREIVKHLTDLFVHYGMDIILGTEATEVERANGKDKTHTYVHLKNGQKVRTDAVLVAQGRAGNTENMGLKEIGVEVDERGLIKVDSRFRTKLKHIYAAGDVIGAPALASTAMEQGRLVSVHGFGLKGWGDGESEGLPKLFPYGVYTIPEISMVGPTEDELKKSGANYVVGRARYHELARGQIVGDRYGILKLLVDRKTLKLLGVHIMGDNAADLIHIGQAVMDFGGEVTYFVRTVFNYPTLAEAYKTAAFHAINQIRGVTKTK